MQFIDGKGQIPPGLLQLKRTAAEILCQIYPQMILILPVGDETVRVVFVVGKGKSVGQVMGQLAQGVILPDIPAGAPLEPQDMGI